MFEARIGSASISSASSSKEETVSLEEYEYLPKNIVDSSFIYTPKGLFAFGGVARCSKKRIEYNL